MPRLSRLATVFIIILLCGTAQLSACAMSALIALQRHSLDFYAPQGQPAKYWLYNDPWDYIGFVMANSTPYSNSDGYGIVAYSRSDPRLLQDDMWYKRIRNPEDFDQMYYTGPYLDEGDQTSAYRPDVLDNALSTIMDGFDHPAIVMCHARSASGLTYGNHPFTFELGNRTYSLMHNGNCNNARTFMINRINQLYPSSDWFRLHPSNYFRSSEPNTWVDTEVLFSYIMCWITLTDSNTLSGLLHALDELKPYIRPTSGSVYNFILSDGEKLYVFRSSSRNSSYKLSYRYFPDEYCAIRTQAPLPGDIELDAMELVVFSQFEKPQHFPEAMREYSLSASPPAGPFLPSSQTVHADRPYLSLDPYSHIVYLHPAMASARSVKTRIYNLKGQLITTTEFTFSPGSRTVVWNGRDRTGKPVASGVYFLRYDLGSEQFTSSIVITK